MTVKSSDGFDPLAGPAKKGAAIERQLTFDQTPMLQSVCGPHDSHLQRIETALEVFIQIKGNIVKVRGTKPQVDRATKALKALYRDVAQGDEVGLAQVDDQLRLADTALDGPMPSLGGAKPRSPGQIALTEALGQHDLTFAVGPAGTGKTFLSVAAAVEAWQTGAVKRLILCRPAVEAGERIGFLPGDMNEKLDPYMRPLYDSLGELLGSKRLAKAMEDGSIEIAPLAFMRGRTLKSAYVILDEGQNATAAQMKMFLTRLGEGSKMVVTGDPTQIDLPRNETSGLVQATQILEGVKGISIVRLSGADVVRHRLVGRIVQAYDGV